MHLVVIRDFLFGFCWGGPLGRVSSRSVIVHAHYKPPVWQVLFPQLRFLHYGMFVFAAVTWCGTTVALRFQPPSCKWAMENGQERGCSAWISGTLATVPGRF